MWKIGRAMLWAATNYKRIDKAADQIGHKLAYITGGRYRVGVSRLAYRVAKQVKLGDKVNILDGRIEREDGSLIVEDSLLKVGKDFGVIPITKRLPTPGGYYRALRIATPEGWAKFLRRIYLKPKTWGIHFADEFGGDRRGEIKEEIDYLHFELTGHPLSQLPIFIKDFSLKNLFFASFNNGLPWIFRRVALPLMLSATIFPMASLTISIGILVGATASFFFGAVYTAKSAAPGSAMYYENLNTLLLWFRLGIHLTETSRHESTYHEYTHHLRNVGYIKNDIIAAAVEVGTLWSLRQYSPLDDNPLDGINNMRKIYCSIVERKWAGKVGEQFGEIARFLATRTRNKGNFWRFLRIVSEHTKKEKLLAALREDKEFAPFFVSR